MAPGAGNFRWTAVTASVRGHAHERSNTPNQDAVDSWVSPSGDAAIAVVADGHGSARSFRSATGAAFAAEVGTRLLRELCDAHRDSSAEEVREAASHLRADILQAWSTRVLRELDRDPLPAGYLHPSAGEAARQDAMIVYGSTLVGAAATRAWRLLMQLGDGDILHTADGGAAMRPLGMPVSLGVETTSLASPQLVDTDFRIQVDGAPAADRDLYVLATDGYANSFADDAGFLAVGTDLWRLIEERGLEWVTHQLPGWLGAASAGGSGDDISVGLLVAAPS